MQKMRNHTMYFDDMLTAIVRILEYTEGYDFQSFKHDY